MLHAIRTTNARANALPLARGKFAPVGGSFRLNEIRTLDSELFGTRSEWRRSEAAVRVRYAALEAVRDVLRGEIALSNTKCLLAFRALCVRVYRAQGRTLSPLDLVNVRVLKQD